MSLIGTRLRRPRKRIANRPSPRPERRYLVAIELKTTDGKRMVERMAVPLIGQKPHSVCLNHDGPPLNVALKRQGRCLVINVWTDDPADQFNSYSEPLAHPWFGWREITRTSHRLDANLTCWVRILSAVMTLPERPG